MGGTIGDDSAGAAARANRWVGQELALFRKLHPDRPILAALIGGEPSEALPEALLTNHGASIEPLAADFQKGLDGKRLGLLKTVAGLTTQSLDRLVQSAAQIRQPHVIPFHGLTGRLWRNRKTRALAGLFDHRFAPLQ